MALGLREAAQFQESIPQVSITEPGPAWSCWRADYDMKSSVIKNWNWRWV